MDGTLSRDLISVIILAAIASTPWGRKILVALKTSEKDKREKAALEFEPVAYPNSNSLASAHFAADAALKQAGLFLGRGWRIGETQSNRVFRYGGPGHLILISPSRTGKMVSVLCAALLERPNPIASRLIIDPKGELCAITHARAAKFSEVVAIDPFGTLKKHGVRGVKCVGFNPLAPFDPKDVSFGGDVECVTDGTFVHEKGSGDNAAFFNDSAALLYSTGIRTLLKYGRPEQKNLVAVREEICRDVFGFAKRYVNCGDEFVRDELSRYTSKLAPQSKSLEDILSTFRTQTSFIGLEGIRESLMDDGVRALDLKRRPMTVYFILPLDKLPTPAVKWFRLGMSTWLCEFLKAGPKGLPVLCVCDEFYSVCAGGPMKIFQTAMSQAAGAANLQLWPVLQDLAQLETLAPNQGWRTFLSNTAVKIFFGGSMLDKETSEYISELCGEREIVVHSRSLHRDRRTKEIEVSNGASTVWQRLMQPHEVRRMHEGMIVFCEKVSGPILAKRRPYFEIPEFRGQYLPNPYYKRGR